MAALMTAKMMYVLYPMLEKATGVIITTMKFQIQFPLVETALAGARIRKGTISAGYSQVMPSQPMAKKVLKMKRKTVDAMPELGVPIESVMARMTILPDIPAAPNSISWRRPNLSMVKTAIQEAAKYSVPLQAAMRRERKSERPTCPCRIVGM